MLRLSRGDTIIEVMIAITIFSLVAVSSMAIMNQGMAAAQRSLEITLVRQQMSSQAEALRYFNSGYVADYVRGKTDYAINTPAGQWQEILTKHLSPAASSFGDCTGSTGALKTPTQGFTVNTTTAKISTMTPTVAGTYAQVDYSGGKDAQGAGLWVEAVESAAAVPKSATNTARYVDFHIRACWSSPGQSAPVALGTIVRLYEPAN